MIGARSSGAVKGKEGRRSMAAATIRRVIVQGAYLNYGRLSEHDGLLHIEPDGFIPMEPGAVRRFLAMDLQPGRKAEVVLQVNSSGFAGDVWLAKDFRGAYVPSLGQSDSVTNGVQVY